MKTITEDIGKRIRTYRLQAGLSQEKLAELASCNATYLGEIERGEKSASVRVIVKIALALQVPLSKLFENIDGIGNSVRNIPQECYELLLSKSNDEQECLLDVLRAVERYKEG